MSIYKVKFRDEKWIPFLEKMGPLDNVIIKGTFLHQAVNNFNVHTEPVVSTIKFNPVNTKVDIDGDAVKNPNTVKLNVLPLRAANFDKVKVVSQDESIVTAAYDNTTGKVTLTPVKDGEAFVTAYVDEPDAVYPEYGEYGTVGSDPNSVLRVNVYKGSVTTKAIEIKIKEDTKFNYQDDSFHIAEGTYLPVEQLVTIKEFRSLGKYDGEHIDNNVEVIPSNPATIKNVKYLGKEALHFTQNGEFIITVRSKAFSDISRRIKVTVYNHVSDIPKRKDVEGPVIEEPEIPEEASFNSDLSIPVTLTAKDNVDGEIVAHRTIFDGSGSEIDDIDTTKPGTYTIKYTAEDSSGNISELVYTVKVNEYVDDVKPTINYLGDNPIVIEYGETFNMPEVTVSDNWDENPTLDTVIRNDIGDTIESIDTSVPGSYLISYTATDSNNNTEGLDINVVVNEYVDDVQPTINYDGSNPIIVEYGETFNMPEVTVSDNWDDEPTLESVIQNDNGDEVQSIDTETPGNYLIKYTATDSSNNTKELQIDVIVNEYIDNEDPIIEYNGADPIVLEYLEDFVVPEVTVSDNWDDEPTLDTEYRNSTGHIVDTIDTAVPGNYSIVFTAADNSGNQSAISVGVVVNEAPPEPEPEPEPEPDPEPEVPEDPL